MEQQGPDGTGSKQSEPAAANLAQLDKCLEVLKAAKSDTEKFAALMLVCSFLSRALFSLTITFT